jgi:hypothetical protein
MPTGYTAGILDGKTTTFPQFAKQCMRAFGASIHLRDEPSDLEFTERTPSNYYKEQIEKAKQTLESVPILSDEEIINSRKTQLEKEKENCLQKIEKSKVDSKNLNDILIEINNWQPPTSEHFGIKDFMVDQIKKTIDFDCNAKYYIESLAKIELQLLTLIASEIRMDLIKNAKKYFEYNTKNFNEDVEMCNQSNKWISDFVSSLSK